MTPLQTGHKAKNSVQISKYKILIFPIRKQIHIVSMALASANFNKASLSNLPLSSLISKNCFQIIWEEIGEEIGTCGLMQEDTSVARIKANEKKQPNLMNLLLLTQWGGSLGN